MGQEGLFSGEITPCNQSLEPLTDRQRLEVLAILDEQVPIWLRWAQWLAAWFL